MTVDQQDAFEPLFAPGPVSYSPERKSWQISQYRDVKFVEIYQHEGLFLREYHAQYQNEQALFRAMWGRDAPAHTHLRQMTVGDFRERSVLRLEQETRACAHQLLLKALRKGSGYLELVEEFARPLAQAIVCSSYLGIQPEYDGDWLDRWLRLHPSVQMLSDDDMKNVGKTWINQRMAQPRGAVVDQLLAFYQQGTIVGNQPMTELDVLGYIGMIAVGGYESLGNTMAAVLAALLEQQEVLEELRASPHPTLLTSVVEEALRLHPAFPVVCMTARETLSLGGMVIHQGEDVMAWLSAANRDPAVFVEPDLFRQRAPNPHLTFGFGMHYCMGAGLSRLLIKIAVEVFLEVVPARVLLKNLAYRPFFGWDYSLAHATILYGN